MFRHSIQNNQELTHTGGKRHLWSFSSFPKTFVKCLDNRVTADSCSQLPCKALHAMTLPPHTERLPFIVPLSRLRGATPTREAICLRLRRPSSGNCASRVAANTGPTPGTLRSRFSLSRQIGLERSKFLRSLSKSFKH